MKAFFSGVAKGILLQLFQELLQQVLGLVGDPKIIHICHNDQTSSEEEAGICFGLLESNLDEDPTAEVKEQPWRSRKSIESPLERQTGASVSFSSSESSGNLNEGWSVNGSLNKGIETVYGYGFPSKDQGHHHEGSDCAPEHNRGCASLFDACFVDLVLVLLKISSDG